MINEKATWSSFSGALAKVERDRATIPSKEEQDILVHQNEF